jgi:hypothetical protein
MTHWLAAFGLSAALILASQLLILLDDRAGLGLHLGVGLETYDTTSPRSATMMRTMPNLTYATELPHLRPFARFSNLTRLEQCDRGPAC